MEENQLMIIKNPEKNSNIDISGVIVKKSKRKLKRRKKGWLLILIILISATAVGIRYRDTLKNFAINLLPEKNAENTGQSTEGNFESVEDNAESESNAENSNIIHTSPNEFQFNNESSTEIQPNKVAYSFVSANDIYASFSTTSPVILLVSFSPYESYYNVGNTDFYSDSKNVLEIGKHICDKLNSLGVNACYLTVAEPTNALVDSKELYEITIKETLSKYPSISYILDISRYVEINSDSLLEKETVLIDNAKTPTIRLVNGDISTISKENFENNVNFSNKLAEKINMDFPLLVSKHTISRYSLFQAFDVPTVRVEIGSYACTFEEALNTSELFAHSIAKVLLQ